MGKIGEDGERQEGGRKAKSKSRRYLKGARDGGLREGQEREEYERGKRERYTRWAREGGVREGKEREVCERGKREDTFAVQKLKFMMFYTNDDVFVISTKHN